MIKVKIKISKKFRKMVPEVDKAMVPLLKLASGLGSVLGNRAAMEQRTHRGTKFKRYPDLRKTRDGKIWYTWVGKGYPRPPALTVKNSKGTPLVGEDGGWAYRSRQIYQTAHGGPKSHSFNVTGGMWDGFTLKPMSPTRVRLLFTGGSIGITGKKTSNKDKAKYGMQWEDSHPLRPNGFDLGAILMFVEVNFFDAILKDWRQPTPWERMMAAEAGFTGGHKRTKTRGTPKLMKRLKKGGWKDRKSPINWRAP